MKRMYLLALVLLGVLLTACSAPATPPPATATAVLPTAAPAAAPTLQVALPTQESPAGGVEVALALVTIPDQPTLAKVEGEAISTLTYAQELTRALNSITKQYTVDWNDPENQSFLPGLQQQVLDQLVERAILRRLANQEGVKISSEALEAEVASLQTRMQESGQFADWAAFLKDNAMTEDDVRAVLTENLMYDALNERHAAPKSVEQVHASHILVETEETGKEVLDKLVKGEAFADLAAEYSTDTGSKENGGDLGWFPRGMMVSEFEQVAFSLAVSKTSELVKTDFGYHIILVHDKGQREVEEAMYDQIQEQAFQEWFEGQKAKLSVERLYTFESPQPTETVQPSP